MGWPTPGELVNIPVVTVILQYTGLSPREMEQRVTTYSEYSISASVNDIRNMESQRLEGIPVQKIYFQPNVGLALCRMRDAPMAPSPPSADLAACRSTCRRPILADPITWSIPWSSRS
jgi:hypothetical protein